MLQRDAGTTLGAAGSRYLKIIHDASKQMGALVDDLLLFSRMARVDLVQTSVNMNALVAEVQSELAPDTADRNIDWEVDDLPLVHGDRSMLKQVWVNLLSNAVKYTRRRNVARIEIRCVEEDPGGFEFTVRDNGAGFDMKYVNRLFGVFQRLHRADEFEGTGIGLANVRRIVIRHGGRVWAEGAVDEGATFHFTLPRGS
jgi:light-regulated signal transduction histidine kinase (bacteriophytochrome)